MDSNDINVTSNNAGFGTPDDTGMVTGDFALHGSHPTPVTDNPSTYLGGMVASEGGFIGHTGHDSPDAGTVNGVRNA